MKNEATEETQNDFFHLPVMAHEAIGALKLTPGNTVIDATLGGGGHAALILKAISPSGKLIGIDRDEDALSAAQKNLSWASERTTFVHGRMGDLKRIMEQLGVKSVHGIIADLGVSSFQLDSGERGFSFRLNGPLDMRMDRSSGKSALKMIGEMGEENLMRLIRDFGYARNQGNGCPGSYRRRP